MYRYQEIGHTIQQRILSEEYKPGTRLPHQQELASEFHTTRVTIKKALQPLLDKGVIYSKRGLGTFIKRNLNNVNNATNIAIDEPDLRREKASSKIIGFSARLPNKIEQKILLVDAFDPVYEIKKFHFQNNEIVDTEQSIIPTDIIHLKKARVDQSIATYIHKKLRLSISGYHRVLTAEKANENDVTIFKIKSSDLILVLTQIGYLENGQPFEYLKYRFPTKHNTIVANIKFKA